MKIERYFSSNINDFLKTKNDLETTLNIALTEQQFSNINVPISLFGVADKEASYGIGLYYFDSNIDLHKNIANSLYYSFLGSIYLLKMENIFSKNIVAIHTPELFSLFYFLLYLNDKRADLLQDNLFRLFKLFPEEAKMQAIYKKEYKSALFSEIIVNNLYSSKTILDLKSLTMKMKISSLIEAHTYSMSNSELYKKSSKEFKFLPYSYFCPLVLEFYNENTNLKLYPNIDWKKVGDQLGLLFDQDNDSLYKEIQNQLKI